MSETLPVTRFGNPVLREVARQLSDEEILSAKTQTLIENMRYNLVEKSYGVGIAAPQVVQHETDHLNGVLFVDHVIDSSSFMMSDEYRKRALGK